MQPHAGLFAGGGSPSDSRQADCCPDNGLAETWGIEQERRDVLAGACACTGLAQMEAAGDFEDSDEEDADFDAGGADLDEASDDYSGSDDEDAEVRLTSHHAPFD